MQSTNHQSNPPISIDFVTKVERNQNKLAFLLIWFSLPKQHPFGIISQFDRLPGDKSEINLKNQTRSLCFNVCCSAPQTSGLSPSALVNGYHRNPPPTYHSHHHHIPTYIPPPPKPLLPLPSTTSPFFTTNLDRTKMSQKNPKANRCMHRAVPASISTSQRNVSLHFCINMKMPQGRNTFQRKNPSTMINSFPPTMMMMTLWKHSSGRQTAGMEEFGRLLPTLLFIPSTTFYPVLLLSSLIRTLLIIQLLYSIQRDAVVRDGLEVLTKGNVCNFHKISGFLDTIERQDLSFCCSQPHFAQILF